MRRRRSKEEDGFRLIAALVMLVVGVWIFVPAFRPWLVGIAMLAALAGIAVGGMNSRNSKQDSDRTSAHQALSVFEEAMKPEPAIAPIPAPPLASSIQETHTSVLAALRRIDWFHFEKVIEALYLSHGYTVRRLGGAHPDGGVDLIVTTPDDRFVVQCKHWRKELVGVKNIRELLGTLTDSGIPKGVYVTMRGYSDTARDVGVRNGLVLLDEKQLVELIVALGPDDGAQVVELLNDLRKFCPKCEAEMRLRTAKRGKNAGKQFWGCSDYPKCDGTWEHQPIGSSS